MPRDAYTFCGCGADDEEGSRKDEVGDGAKDEETPFVGRLDDSAGEPGDYPDPGDSDVIDY